MRNAKQRKDLKSPKSDREITKNPGSNRNIIKTAVTTRSGRTVTAPRLNDFIILLVNKNCLSPCYITKVKLLLPVENVYFRLTFDIRSVDNVDIC